MTTFTGVDLQRFIETGIDAQDDFLKELYFMGLDLKGMTSKDLKETKRLIELVDEQYAYPSEEHRMRIQVAWLREHQYFLSERENKHVSAGETIFNWMKTYNDSGRNKYFDEYIKNRKIPSHMQGFTRSFAQQIGRVEELLSVA